MKATVMAVHQDLKGVSGLPPLFQALNDYILEVVQGKYKVYIVYVFPYWILLGWYHQGRLEENAPDEFVKHTEKVKSIVPEDRLLTYEVGEGWDRLVEFLGVYVAVCLGMKFIFLTFLQTQTWRAIPTR